MFNRSHVKKRTYAGWINDLGLPESVSVDSFTMSKPTWVAL